MRFAFAGDSGNDAACFAAFRTTFGVANVRASLARLSVTPRYVATRTMGEGFAEIAAADPLGEGGAISGRVTRAHPGRLVVHACSM